MVHADDATELQWDLAEIIEECDRRDIAAPVLVRFTPIIKSRVEKLHQAFGQAIE